ncbi:MAG: ATP-binding protein [Anaerolineae bacterium]|nr:ATP-binding protein [Anaerolineae bacterium]
MLDKHKVDDLRQYLLDRMRIIFHPFDPENTTKEYRFQNLPELVDVWLAFLALECPEEQIEEVGPRIVQAFHDYSTALHGDWEKAANAVDLIATKFESFLKKVFRYRYDAMPDDRLYRLLNSHKVISLTVQMSGQPDIEFWRQQPAREAIVEKAYLLRNPAAHEARAPKAIENSMHTILAACLFVVEENLDLLKQKVQEQEAVREWEDFLQYKMTLSGSSTEAAAVVAVVTNEWEAYLRYAIQFFDDVHWEEEKYLWPRVGDTDLLEQMDEFINDDARSVLFIIGRPGAGKTAFMKRWANRLAGEALNNLEAPDSVRPETLVPIYVDLNNYTARSEPSFSRHVVADSGLAKYIRADPEVDFADPEQSLRHSSVRFVVCLDALDEMKQDPDDWERSLETIKRFLNAGLVSKIVVTCRDEVMPGPWHHRYQVLDVAPLTLDEIRDYYYIHLGDGADVAYAFIVAPERQELLELMHIPLMLEATVEYWKQFEPSPLEVEGNAKGSSEKIELTESDDLPSSGNGEIEDEDISEAQGPLLGKLVADLFDQVLEWERSKSLHRGWDLGTLEWQEKLSKLAYEVDGKDHVSRNKALELIEERDLVRFKNMGVLCTYCSGLGFFNRLACAYFAALELKRTIEESGDVTLPPNYQEQRHIDFWRRCAAILQEVTSRDVSNLTRQLTVLC